MITVHTDGGARGNPGPAAIGVVIDTTRQGRVMLKKTIGSTTNNVAEYTAVQEALNWLLTHIPEGEREEVTVYLDSQLVQRQLIGVYKIKEPSLLSLATTIQRQIKMLGTIVMFVHIPREQNREADSLVNAALDQNL